MEKILPLLLERLTLNLSLARIELKNLWQISLSLSFLIYFLWGRYWDTKGVTVCKGPNTVYVPTFLKILIVKY